MSKKTPHSKKWFSVDDILPFSLQCKTRTEFYKRFPKAYQGAKDLKVLDLACVHMPKDASVGKKPHNKKWTKETVLLEALKYDHKSKFIKLSRGAYNVAWSMGILDEVCKHMEKAQVLSGENHPNFKWTFSMVLEEALKYKTRGEFRKNSVAYGVALDREILDQVCAHMPKFVCGEDSHSYKWTDDMLAKEALKYKTRTEFQQNSSAYGVALERKILDQICAHMKASSNASLAERNLFDFIKTIYPKTQRMMDRKVKIEGKPHIKGLALDIYIPELRLAIEFNGKYWHSTEGLKRSRSHWPEEDIKNYHEIKNAWFATKGIKILHIKEEDWIKDKRACIDKSLEFLGVTNG